MNSNQKLNIITSILQPVLAYFVTRGWLANSEVESTSAAVGMALLFIFSHIWHSEPPSSNTTTPPNSGNSGAATLLLLFILPALLFVGCANLSNNAFTLEQTAATTSDAAMKSYATYFDTAITNPAAFNRTQVGLIAEREQVQDASAKVGTAIELVENLRESYATNSAVEPQLQAAVTALSQNLADEISFVGSLTATNKTK